MTHELDSAAWAGLFEPDNAVPDETTHMYISYDWAEMIMRKLSEEGRDFYEGSMLGLAAGWSEPEMYIARRIGIPYRNITLVDKNFSGSMKQIFAGEYSEVNAVESGMFEFLETTQKTDYSLVTALSIEYALKNPVAMDTFISLLPRIMQPGGIVLVFPYTGDYDPSSQWQSHGFEPLKTSTTYRGGSHNRLAYVFRGIPKEAAK